jgi:hypothetical protein
MKPDHPIVCFAIFATLVACSPGVPAAGAEPATAKIVGLGATPCQQFEREANERPAVQREYFAWAQGFMSGILMGRPPGVDVGLDLNPRSFGLGAVRGLVGIESGVVSGVINLE